jgi:hypothetical protein
LSEARKSTSLQVKEVSFTKNGAVLLAKIQIVSNNLMWGLTFYISQLPRGDADDANPGPHHSEWQGHRAYARSWETASVMRSLASRVF